MEKKTMGGFIAALRRANGMTQRELAEKLNVSDKSVSRWERDDGAPDLALIPVLAEVFGVTCDELLRGERASAETATQTAAHAEKTEKQRRRLLASSLARFRTRGYLTLALAAAGFLIAHGCNAALERALIGFFLGAVFFVGAAAVGAVQLSTALLAVEDDALSGDDIDAYRRAVVHGAERIFGATWVLFATTLPLLLAFRPVNYNGFTLSRTTVGVSFAWYWLVGIALAALATWYIAVKVAEKRLAAGKILPEAEGSTADFPQNRRLRRTIALVLCIVLGVSIFANRALVGFGDTRRLVKGTTFTDLDDFSRFMWQKVDADESGYGMTSEPVATPSDETEGIWRAICDENGGEVYTYYQRNWSVSSIAFGDAENDYLPITVYTQSDMRIAQNRARTINVAFCVLYALECGAAVLIYRRHRET